MTEQLFTDYKYEVASFFALSDFSVKDGDEGVVLGMQRLAHRNSVTADRCAVAIMALAGARLLPPDVDLDQRIELTEAGANVLEMDASLKAVDGRLGLPPSSPSSAPPPSDTDPCEDDVARVLAEKAVAPAAATPVAFERPLSKGKKGK